MEIHSEFSRLVRTTQVPHSKNPNDNEKKIKKIIVKSLTFTIVFGNSFQHSFRQPCDVQFSLNQLCPASASWYDYPLDYPCCPSACNVSQLWLGWNGETKGQPEKWYGFSVGMPLTNQGTLLILLVCLFRLSWVPVFAFAYFKEISCSSSRQVNKWSVSLSRFKIMMFTFESSESAFPRHHIVGFTGRIQKTSSFLISVTSRSRKSRIYSKGDDCILPHSKIID